MSDLQRNPETAGVTVTRAYLTDALFNTLGVSKREARMLVDALFDEMTKALGEGAGLKLTGFGNFVLRDKSQREGRNPKTGKSAVIEARRVVVFHPAQMLKSRVEGYVHRKG